MVSEETIKIMKELHKIEKHDGVSYCLDRAFTCFNKELTDGTSRPCTELLDYYKISYNEPKDGEDDSVDTLNFCFAKHKDRIEVTAYCNINKIHLNFNSLKNTKFWGNQKYNLIIHNDHKKRVISFARHMESMLMDFKYINDLGNFLAINSDCIKSVKFININPITLPTLNRLCQHFGIDTVKKTSLSNSFIPGILKAPLHRNKGNKTNFSQKESTTL